MSCTITRIDDLNFNPTAQVNPSHSVYDASRGKVYFVYCDLRTSRNPTDSENRAVMFREWDVATEAFLSPVVIEEIPHGVAEDSDNIDRASIVRLDSGVLICAYYYFSTATSLNRTHVKESTDNGATWSAAVLMDSGVGSSRLFVDLGTDGTHVYGFTYQNGGGAGGQNLWAWIRTAASTWDGGHLVYDGHVGGPSSAEVAWQYNGGRHMVAVSDAATAFILVQRLYSGTQQRVTCFRTADTGASWQEVVVSDMGTDLMNAYPICQTGADGRVRAMWLKTNPTFPTCKMPVLAYTDDDGLTWTTIGTPTLLSINDTQAWHAQNKGFLLGASDNMILSTWRQNLGAGLWTIQIFGGGDALSGWSEIVTCDIGSNANSNLVGDSVLIGSDFLQILDPIPNPPGTYYTIAYLRETDVDTGEGGAPPLLTESPSGAELSNIYIRNRLAEKRGWSVHDFQVGWFQVWPEGDYSTQRRLDTLIASVASVDPSVTEPSRLGVLYKIDDPDHYGREINGFDETGAPYIRLDPFKFVVETSDIPFGDLFGVGLLRGYLIRYSRQGDPFTVEFLVDGQVIQTEVLSPSWPEPVDIFLPVATDENLGSKVRMRIIDETVYPLIIEAIAPMYIDKGVRG